MKKRILAISDIHGCYDKLVELLEIAKYNHNADQLVILGDLCDRGSENMKTIFFARQLQRDGAVVIMGNHDKVAYLSMSEIIEGGYGEDTQLHINCLNGYETNTEFMKLSDVDKKIARNFLKSLPLYYEFGKYIFVHAGVSPNKGLEDNKEDALLWSREEFYDYPSYDNKITIFGHTPTHYLSCTSRNNLQEIWFDNIHGDKIGVDCGCVFYGRLGCLEIDLKTGEYNTYYTK